MIELSLSNLATYSAQVLLVVLVAEARVQVTRAESPGMRLAYWRAAVAGCLTLPLLTTVRPVIAAEYAVAQLTQVEASSASTSIAATRGISMASAIGWVVALGIVLRSVWLLVGVLRLRWLHASSKSVVLDEDLEALRQGLAPHASVWSHANVLQPIPWLFSKSGSIVRGLSRTPASSDRFRCSMPRRSTRLNSGITRRRSSMAHLSRFSWWSP